MGDVGRGFIVVVIGDMAVNGVGQVAMCACVPKWGLGLTGCGRQ